MLPSHHEVIRAEIEAGTGAIAELSKKIDELTATRNRFTAFVSAMQEALIRIPEQLELELVVDDTPKPVG